MKAFEWRPDSKWLVAAALVVALALGCSTAGDKPAPSAGPAPAAAACPRGSLEGCFGYEGMAAYLETVEPLVARFFAAQYPRLKAPRDVVLIPARASVRDGCGGFSDSRAFEYCPANATIYIGQDLLWSFYRRFGDAAPLAGLAHEWAHHVQFRLGVSQPRANAERVRFENQADCLSGAYIKHARDQGQIEKDDLGDIESLLQAIGARGPRRDHGTAAERRQAFNLGLASGAKGCSSYFPGTPVA
jgi:predicted metalloprotease